MLARRLLAVAALLCLSACAHRFPAKTGGERAGVSGLPMDFGWPGEAVPQGTRIRWDFGDGSSAEGPVASHAWARAGEYTITIEVTDEKGPRSDQAKIRIARRPPASAVPPSARAAVILDRFFARVPQNLSVAERMLGPNQTRRAVELLEGILGFDPTRPEQVLASGVDPEEGLALAWLPDDTGTWLVVGIFDERAALEAARTAFARQEQVSFAPGPAGTTVAQIGKARVQFGVSGGYLYMHLGVDEPSEPKLDFAAPCPPTGLFADPEFAKLRAQVQGDDGFVFVRGTELPKKEGMGRDVSALRAHTRALAAGFSNREAELLLEARVAFDAEGEPTLTRLFATPGRVDLDERAPAGAAAYLSISLAPQALSDWMQGGDRERADEVLGSAGLQLDALAAATSGGAALAAYFDLATFLKEMASGAGPKVRLVGGVGVKDPKDAKARLDAAVAAGKMKAAGEARWEFLEAEGAGVALAGATAFFGHPEALAKTLDPAQGAKRLSEAVRAAVPAQALGPGHQLLYLDVAGFIEQLRNPVLPGGDALDGPRRRQMAMLISTMVEATPELQPLLPMKDFYADVCQDGAALSLKARLRFK